MMRKTAPAVTAVDVPRLPDIVIDGDPYDWSGKGFCVDVLSDDAPRLRSSDEFRAQARLGWNERGLLVMIDVTDPTPCESEIAGGAYERDSVEIFVAPAHSREEGVQLVVSPGHSSKYPDLRAYVYDNRPGALKRERQPSFQLARRLNFRGYTLEAAFDWENIGLTPHDGALCYFRLYVNDAVAPVRRYRSKWASSHEDWHLLRLSHHAAPPVRFAAWGSWTDLRRRRIHLVATRSLAGYPFTVKAGPKVLASGMLKPEGERALAEIELASLEESLDGPIEVHLHGAPSHVEINFPDMKQERLRLLDRADRRRPASRPWPQREEFLRETFAVPEFSQYVLPAPVLPTFEFPDAERVLATFGPYAFSTEFFNVAGKKVQELREPGRYGALVRAKFGDGLEYVYSRTLFRTPAKTHLPARSLASESTAQRLAAEYELGEASRDRAWPWGADMRWWHQFHRTRGEATRYRYVVLLPESYSAAPDRAWPTLLYLHGMNQGSQAIQEAHGILKFKAILRKLPMIVVVPLTHRTWEAPALTDLMDEVSREHRVDADRVYVAGFSMGGYGTWSTIMDAPERYAAAVPVGGGPGFPDLASRLKGLPVWIQNGEEDPATPASEALVMAKAIKLAGGNVRTTIMSGVSHTESHDLAFGDPDLYAWLLAQKRP